VPGDASNNTSKTTPSLLPRAYRSRTQKKTPRGLGNGRAAYQMYCVRLQNTAMRAVWEHV
jgi:hypothetical protein